MPILYVRTGCQFCQRVLDAVEDLGITLELRNVADPAISEELVTRGGKHQMPYLVDEERGVSLYESEDIIAHLHSTFSPNP